MDEVNQDGSEVLETTEEVVEVEETETGDEETPAEDIEAIKAKAADLEQKNKQLFERLKKAEKKEEIHTDNLSNKDVLFLAKADIHEDDLDDVLDMARLKGITVAEAHKFMKPILAERQEERRTASATQTRSTRGAQKNTGEDFLKKAERTGEIPDSDEALRSIVEARLQRRRSKG